MKTPSLIILIPICISFLAIVWALIWHYSPMRKRRLRQQHEYETLYAEIQKRLSVKYNHSLDKTDVKYMLRRLKSLKYRNDEMTNVLACQYLQKYYGDNDPVLPHQVQTANAGFPK